MNINPNYLNKEGKIAYIKAILKALENSLCSSWNVSNNDLDEIVDALEPLATSLNQQDFFGTEGWQKWFD